VQYMLMICGVEGTQPDPADQGGYTIEEWLREMSRRGAWQQGDRQRSTTHASTVRVRNNEVLISDGPFAETKEQMFGYDLIE
jgi:hypothetical protein